MNTPPPLVVLGPTASGKSDVAMAYALTGPTDPPGRALPVRAVREPTERGRSGGSPASLSALVDALDGFPSGGAAANPSPDVATRDGSPSGSAAANPSADVATLDGSLSGRAATDRWATGSPLDGSSVGPSSAGRHGVAQVEIVAVDSMQVYRGMDIGTAKPSAADRHAVAHHCLDLADPDVDFTVVEFARCARAALTEIATRGNRPVLVAGTGLYLRSVTDPMEVPGRWPDVRAEVELRLAAEGSAVLHRQLLELDPLAASRMEPGNARRVVRALEVVLGGGRLFSSYGSGIGVHPPAPFVQVGLQWQRDRLAQRIEVRVHAMLGRGLLSEVEVLAARPSGWSRTARQALGYKELLDHLDGTIGLDEAVATIVTRTRQFAVRQERWFRRDPRVRWVSVNEDPVAEVLPILQHL